MKIPRATLAAVALALLPPDAHAGPAPATPAKQAPAAAPRPWSASALLCLESAYVTEGRDNVPGADGDIVAEGAFNAHGFTAGVWYLDSIGARYEELNLLVGHARDVGPLTLSGSYTYLAFLEDDTHTHELAAAVELPLLDGRLTPFASLVWDARAPGAGTWAEIGAHGSLEFLGGRLAVAPYASLGIDLGYVSQECDDLNHAEIGVEISYRICEHLSAFAHAHQSWALENLEREDLGDLTWAGIGFSVEF